MARGRSTVKTAAIPAPVGGINTIDPLIAFPPTDAVYAYNLVASELGLRARSGYKEWATNVGDGEVRTILPFVGSRTDGSTNRLFAVTATGIWDISYQTSNPYRFVTFAVTADPAGWGSSCVVTTPAGRYLVYCDEANGLFVCSEATGTWTQVRTGPTVPWKYSTSYTVGNIVVNGVNSYVCVAPGFSATSGGPTGQGTYVLDGTVRWDFYEGPWTPGTAYALNCRVTNGATPKRIYLCSQAGTSAASGGPVDPGAGIVDNTCRWNYVSDYSTPIGMALADQQAGFPGTPDHFVFPVVWKSRLWFVERDSTRAWYLPVNSIFGTATSFDFGSRMRAGGPLVGLYDWSYDAGNGLDSLLVALSTTGDVVIYAGTDPSFSTTFGLKGTWNVGPLPRGRRVATEYGGDLLVLSAQGVVPLSKLVVGQPVVVGDRSVYDTRKISNAISAASAAGRTLYGWGLAVHPEDNVLLVLVPSAAGAPVSQFAMSFATRAWTQYRDLPALSAATFDGTLFFGTLDGRVCANTGYVDDIKLPREGQPVAYNPVSWSFLTGFSQLGTTAFKRLLGIRVSVISQTSTIAVKAVGKTRLDTIEPPPPSAAALSTADDVWDWATWDASKWAGDFTSTLQLSGGGVCGRELAVAVRGLSVSRTIVVGLDIQYDVGGDL
jgi:hypothetical protein